MNGVCYVAYGHNARFEARASIKTLQRHNNNPITVIGDEWPVPIPFVEHVKAKTQDLGGRSIKLNLDTLSPYEYTVYIDADTRIHSDLSVGFDILDDGWDIVMVPSTRQGDDVLGNVTGPDRAAVISKSGIGAITGLQAGVFWFRKCDAITTLFAAWREEWQRFRAMDQAALIIALWRAPVRMWLLGWDWNSRDGKIIEHLFGKART